MIPFQLPVKPSLKYSTIHFKPKFHNYTEGQSKEGAGDGGAGGEGRGAAHGAGIRHHHAVPPGAAQAEEPPQDCQTRR